MQAAAVSVCHQMRFADETVRRRATATPARSRVVLFGSRARGDAQAHSDVDLFVIEPSGGGNPSHVQAAAEVIAEGQRRGETRTDQPAESLAVVLCYSVLSAMRRAATLGRPPDSPPLSDLALEVVLRGMRPDAHAREERR